MTSRTLPSRTSPCVRSTSASPARAPPASAMSASSAGSCTSRRSEALHAYEVLRDAGKAHGIADVGYRAIETLRLEKGYVYRSSEVTPDTNPLEAGLGFAVALDKGDFIGSKALAAIKAEGAERRLIALKVDGFAPLIGGETLVCDGTVVGALSSAGYGYGVGHTIAFGYVPGDAARMQSSRSWPAARAMLLPARHAGVYDPTGARLKGTNRMTSETDLADARRALATVPGFYDELPSARLERPWRSHQSCVQGCEPPRRLLPALAGIRNGGLHQSQGRARQRGGRGRGRRIA